MEYFGVFAFIMVCAFSAYPAKTRRLENKVKVLERKLKGENQMSMLINDLVGRHCVITGADVFESKLECTVLAADDEWVKIQYTDKKSGLVTKLIRIEKIDEVDVQD